jgi:ATP-dependent RNA helicase DDX23/PRP28
LLSCSANSPHTHCVDLNECNAHASPCLPTDESASKRARVDGEAPADDDADADADAKVAKPEPLSLEELLEKKKREEEEIARPKFLTKAERAEIALKKRAAEVESMRAAQKQQKNDRVQLVSDGRSAGRGGYNPRADRLPPPPPPAGMPPPPGAPPQRAVGAGAAAGGSEFEVQKSRTEREQELKAIRERYLGGKKKERRVRKMNEKKFVFDWDHGEDTSTDYNPIYSSKHEAQLFGRGHIAGIDVVSQKKVKSQFYDALLEERRTIEEKEQEDRRLDKLKLKEKRTKHDDRHWRAKPLDEMTERDWRIFKEDFNIGVRGG